MKNQLLDYLFENRNKAYGAYELRTNYAKRLTRALAWGVSSVCLILFSSFIYLKENKPLDKPIKPKIIELDDIRLPKDPIQKKEETLPPASPPARQEKLVETEPVEDNATENEPISNLKDIMVATVSTQTQKGPDVVTAIPIPPAPVIGPPVEAPQPTIKPANNEILLSPEVFPSFPDGNEALYTWLGKELKYPALAQRHQVQGKVFVSFVVEKDGSISQIEILKPIGFGLDEEAVRAIKKMPKWNPGKQNGQAVRVRFTLPITFKFSN